MSDKLYLFADNNEGTAENLGSYRLYNMKIEGDSQGVESGVDYVDCLIGDSASYINTGIAVATNYQIDVTFMLTDKTSYSGIGGAIYGASNDLTVASDSTYGTSVAYVWNGTVTIRDNGSGGANNHYKNFNINESTCLNNKYTLSRKLVNVTNNKSLYLMANHVENNANHKSTSSLRIYDFKIYNNQGTLIQHLRPCLDTEGVPCMYDEVSGEYFHNQGTGTFGYKKELRDFQPVLDSNGIPCLMDKINKKYYYDKNKNLFDYAEQGEYQRVGYISRHTSSDYIPTGLSFTFDENTVIKFGFNLNSYGGSEIFQIKNGITVRTSDNTKMRVGDLSLPVGQADNKNHDGILTTTNLTVSWGDTPYEFTDLGLTGGTGELIIFVGNNYYGMGCINYLQIYQSNELVFDGVPALDNEGTPCMYDLVTETFFYNQGTGEFSYGIEELECPPANYVEYIETEKYGDYIDTGINQTRETTPNRKYEYGMMWNEVGEGSYVHGIVQNTWNQLIGIYAKTSGLREKYFSGNYGLGNSDYEKIQAEFNTKYDIIMDYKNSYVEIKKGDTSIYTSNEFAIGDNQYDLLTLRIFIGKDSNVGVPGSYMLGRIYYFRAYENDELIQELLPCLDDNNVPCMYNTISGEYFYNQGEGNFAYGKSIGYTPIKYIETNGTQYIDTGVIVNDNTYMDIDYRAIAKEYTPVEYLQGDGASYIDTGIPITTGYDIECNYGHDIPTMTGIIFGLSDKNNPSNGNTPKLRINYIPTPSSDFNYDNNCTYSQFSNKTWNTTEGCIFSDCTYDNTSSFNCFLFGASAINVAGVSEPCHMCDCFISMFKIWDAEGNLVQHLISVLDSEGTPCMYDLVTETFFYNQGTGTFSYGDVSPSKNYLMNDFYTDTTYKYKEIDTTVEPNLTASAGATLTLGSTYIPYLTESEIEQAIKNGWIIQ